MIKNFNDLKHYLLEDKKALGIKKSRPDFFGDDIWKIEIRLRITDYFTNPLIRG